MSAIQDITLRAGLHRAACARSARPLHATPMRAKGWTLDPQADLGASFGSSRVAPRPDERAP